MASKKEIESLTVGEFMEGLNYAVKQKKHKIIDKIESSDQYQTIQQDRKEEIIREPKESIQTTPQVEKEEIIVEPVQSFQPIKQPEEKEDTNFESPLLQKRFSFEDFEDIKRTQPESIKPIHKEEIMKSKEVHQNNPINIEDTQRTRAIKALFNDEDYEEKKVEKEKKQYNIFLLISFVLGLIYSVYIIYYCITASGSGANEAENIGIGIAVALIFPHLIFAVLATIFNGFGLLFNKRGLAITGAICYTIACIVMPIYFMFTIVQAVLSYIGFAKMKKKVYIPFEQR